MSEDNKMIIALDAMGGDYAPQEQVKGAVQAVQAEQDIIVKLFGDEDRLRSELASCTYDPDRIVIVPTSSIVENCDVPTVAIRKKRDSSMVMGLYALKNGEADAFISCGNTGALLVGGQTIVGRIRGVDRAGLAFLVPTLKHPVLLMDCGANVDVRPEMLVQFARMGSVYMSSVMGVSNPRVGLVNIGEEETKGNKLVQETFPLLKECTDIHFTGSVESRELTEGTVDIAVCDGFVGNIILKTYEGVAAAMLHVVRSSIYAGTASRLGGLLMKKELKKSMKQFSVEEYGGAPMLGLKHFVAKTHGNSKAPEIRNTILQCRIAVREDISGRIARSLGQDPTLQPHQ